MLGRLRSIEASSFLVRYASFTRWLLLPHLAATSALLVLQSRRFNSKAVGPLTQLRSRHASTAAIGLLFVLVVHGTFVAVPLVAASGAWVLIGLLRALRVSTGAACAALWAYAAALLAASAYLEGGGFQFLAHALLGAGRGGAGAHLLAVGAALDALPGLSPPFFTPALVFRYTLLRLLSWGIDLLTGRLEAACRLAAAAAAASAAADEDEEGGSPTIRAVQAGGKGTGGPAAPKLRALPDSVMALPARAKLAPAVGAAVAASLPALLSYIFFPPLFLCGPVLTAADYMSQQQQASGAAAMPANWRRSLLGLTLWAAALEAGGRTLLSDSALLSALAAWPWMAFPISIAVMQALFLQSVVPWTAARLGAGALGLRAPDEAPASWVASSASVRAFWRAFHVSWHRWLKLYVYLPFGGGVQATLAVLALSTALHGGRGPWLTWGAIQCCAILAERALQGRRWAARLPRVARAALAQAAALTTLLVQLPLSPSLPGYLLRFHAVGAPFLLAAAAWRLRRAAAVRGSGPKLGVHTA